MAKRAKFDDRCYAGGAARLTRSPLSSRAASRARSSGGSSKRLARVRSLFSPRFVCTRRVYDPRQCAVPRSRCKPRGAAGQRGSPSHGCERPRRGFKRRGEAEPCAKGCLMEPLWRARMCASTIVRLVNGSTRLAREVSIERCGKASKLFTQAGERAFSSHRDPSCVPEPSASCTLHESKVCCDSPASPLEAAAGQGRDPAHASSRHAHSGSVEGLQSLEMVSPTSPAHEPTVLDGVMKCRRSAGVPGVHCQGCKPHCQRLCRIRRQSEAATKIQATIRRHVQRTHFCRAKAAAVTLQSQWRGGRVRDRVSKMLHAAVAIQAAWRGTLARSRLGFLLIQGLVLQTLQLRNCSKCLIADTSRE